MLENLKISGLKLFIGKTIQQVCFASNVITLYFDISEYINLLGGNLLVQRNGNENRLDSFHPICTDCGLLYILDQELLNVDIEIDKVILTFTNDVYICLEFDQYECLDFTINNERTII